MLFESPDLPLLAASLERASGAVGAKAAAVVRNTAYDIERDAKQLCPVRSGRLRDSISTSIEGDGRFASIQAEIGPTVPYALEVEYGTSEQPPEPFMRPALSQNEPSFVRAMSLMAGTLL